MTGTHLASLIVMAVVTASAIVLFHPRTLASRSWRATVTPLASIIGSGFLVLAPILVREFGGRAVFVMVGLCAFAYAIGGAIRCNIRAMAAGDGKHQTKGWGRRLNRSASWALVFAYVISVSYYLNLFGAFAVSMTSVSDVMHGKLVTTAILILIAVLGWTKGLAGLERATELSVGLKLAIIAGLLAGMTHYAFVGTIPAQLPSGASGYGWDALRLAFCPACPVHRNSGGIRGCGGALKSRMGSFDRDAYASGPLQMN